MEDPRPLPGRDAKGTSGCPDSGQATARSRSLTPVLNVASSCYSNNRRTRRCSRSCPAYTLYAGVALAVAFVRLVKGPALPDRIVAMDLFGMLVVGLIVVFAGSSGVRATLDAAVVIALIGFLCTIGYATYVERADPQ